MNDMTIAPIRRALLSVSDKSGLAAFATRLASAGVELVSTGGTAKALREAGLNIVDVETLTGAPEMLDGRVKTLHPGVHGGILARRDDAAHLEALKTHDISAIDLVVINLYPFEETVAKGANFTDCIENIDIGGPAMIRAAAKNHAHVAVVVDPADYDELGDAIEADKGLSGKARQRLALKAFSRTAAYDAAVSQWLAGAIGEAAPKWRAAAGELKQSLRYGENPHQNAAFYVAGEARPGIATAEQIQGKELSYNNLNDTNAAFELLSEFEPETPAVVIVKHANPCGVALGGSLSEAYDLALRTDPTSAFGGIIALNQTIDGEAAERITARFAEVVIAPDADEAAKAIFAKKKNLRLLLTGGLADPNAVGAEVKAVAGGYLFQSRDNGRISETDLKVVTKRAPDSDELRDLLFAWRVAKHVKSNTIVYARNGATAGVGAGQMSRVDAALIAARKAQDAAREAGIDQPLTADSVAASDAFFPFADGLEVVAEAGAKAVIQPGGSIRDDEVIAAADRLGIAMVFTGMRHFRH